MFLFFIRICYFSQNFSVYSFLLYHKLKMSESLDKKVETESESFYTISQEYWKNQPATVDGMLGGYEYVSKADIEQSQLFLDSFLRVRLNNFNTMFYSQDSFLLVEKNRHKISVGLRRGHRTHHQKPFTQKL